MLTLIRLGDRAAEVLVMGVLAVPVTARFSLALEQTRVDNAAASLQTIWRAQRMHRFETGSFTTDMDRRRDER